MEKIKMFRRGDDIYVDVEPRVVTHEMIEKGYFLDSQIKLSLKEIQQLEDKHTGDQITGSVPPPKIIK